MKKIFCLALFFCLNFLPVNAEVFIPEFSFTGEDISRYSVSPSYMDVSLSFNVSSGLDTYLRQESFQVEDTQEKGYKSTEPSGMYSGSFGTGLSSIFVGEKAYRNNIVKNYIRKDYIQVIDSYTKYLPKLEKSPYYDECRLLYALALMETGNLSGGAALLKDISKTGGIAGDIASDSLFSYYFKIKNYNAVIEAGRAQTSFTEYSLYTYLYSLMQKKEYGEIFSVYEKQMPLFEKYPYMYDFVIVSDYLSGKHDEVAKLADKATENTMPMVADTLLSLDNRAIAEKLIAHMKEGEAKNALLAKISILDGNLAETLEYMNKLNHDENRLNVFFFYVNKKFPNLMPSFTDEIIFNNPANRDYVNYYSGLSAMAVKDYPLAVQRLNSVIFNQRLMESAYFYRGIAYFRSDLSKTEFLLLKFIDASDEKEKVNTARYILGQIYYMKRRANDALMLVENCTTDDCSLLKAEISIDRQEYDKAENLIKNIRNDRAETLRAAVMYNKKDYKGALAKLNTISQTDSESDYLLMLIFLKMDRYEDAMHVYEDHTGDARFFDTLSENLFLAGDYNKVLALLDKSPADKKSTLIRAKVYTSTKKYKEAEPLYRSLIASDYAVFDSVYGLLSGYAAMNMKSEFLKTGEMTLAGLGKFERKDFLLIQAARLAIDMKEIDLATKMVNRFFSEFPDSQYLREGYLLRGKLFKNTGRLEQCIADANRMIASGGNTDDAIYLKADCTEAKNAAEAVKMYLDLADSSERFKELANSRIAEISSKPEEVKKASDFFKESDPAVYYKGIDRYLTMLGASDLVNNESFIREMIETKNSVIVPGAYFNLGRLLEVKRQPDQAATAYMKGYYLFPESKYAKQSLRKTVTIYKQQGKTKEAELLEKKLSGK